MKKSIAIILSSGIFLTCGVFPGCSSDDPLVRPDTEENQNNGSGDTGDNGSGTGSGTSGSSSEGDVASFTIGFDKTALDETLTIDASDDDFVENSTFEQTIGIVFSTTGDASVTGDTDGIVKVRGNDVVVDNTSGRTIRYELSGTTTDGFFKLYSTKKSRIELNGVRITNPDGAAINNQSKKRTFVVLADGTENYLADGTSYADETDDEDMKATFFSEGQLIFSGKGSLEIDANCKAAIRSDDYVRTMPGVNICIDASSGNGIRGNDGVTISGGVLNINITGTADKGLSSDGEVLIGGGRTTVLTSGGYEWDDTDNDYSACAGIKAADFKMDGGELLVLSTGIGGKGVSSDNTLDVSGGTIKVITQGNSYKKGSYGTSPKGLKADGDLTVSGGRILVRSSHSEGIESKGRITLSGGSVECYAYDDAINSKGDMTISGGYVYARATNNDGLDANGNVILNGGVVIALGGPAPEVGIDAAEGYSIFVNGGTVLALAQSVAATSSSSKQASVTASVQKGTRIALFDGSTSILSYEVPSNASGTALMLSSPALKSGSSYTLKSGVSITGGTSFYGLATDGTVSGGSGSASLTAALSVGSGMGGGFPDGGGHGGRDW